MSDGFQWDGFWAAAFGALAAFILGGLGQWYARNSARQEAVNKAILTLAQMWSQLVEAKKVVFDIRVEEVTKERGRAPEAWEYSPLAGGHVRELKLDIGPLTFLTLSHRPNVLNELMHFEFNYLTNLSQLRQLEGLQLEFMARASKAGLAGGVFISRPELVKLIGAEIIFPIESIVEDLPRLLADTAANGLRVQDELLEAATVMLPTRTFSKVYDVAKVKPGDVTAKEPARWRVALRATVKRYRSRKRIKPNH